MNKPHKKPMFVRRLQLVAGYLVVGFAFRCAIIPGWNLFIYRGTFYDPAQIPGAWTIFCLMWVVISVAVLWFAHMMLSAAILYPDSED